MARDETLILVSAIVNYVPYGYMNVVPLIYLLKIGYTPEAIGLVYAMGAVAATVGLVPFGILTDRYSKKRLLILAATLPAVSYATFGLTTAEPWLILASAVGGVGFGGGFANALQTPALYSRLARGAAESRRATLLALVGACWVVAQGAGAILSFLPAFLQSALAQSLIVSHDVSYLVMAAMAVLSAVPLFFLTEESRPNTRASDKLSNRTSETPAGAPRTFEKYMSPRAILLSFSVVFALAGFGTGMLAQLLPTWYNLKFGVSEGTAGLWIAAAQIPSVAAVPLIPFLLKRRGALFASVATGFVAAVFVFFMPLAGQFESTALLFVGRSFFWSISWSVIQSYLIGSVREEKRGTALGVTYTAWSVANAAATLVGGYLFTLGLLLLPLTVAIITSFGIVTALLAFFRKARPGLDASGREASSRIAN